MCKCNVECFLSDYNTSICPGCGLEKIVSIIITPTYSSNQTLSVGYSRSNRFRIILDQLFNPLQYGRANSRVLYHLNKVEKGLIKNGVDMIEWLTALQVSDKRYQCVHYYFVWYHDKYEVPPLPSKKKIRDIEMQFSVLEANFRISKYKSDSFFSYNWLLLKLLELYPSFFHYTQFVKRIKCKHRYKKYLKMYTILRNVNNVLVIPGDVGDCQKLPGALLGDDFPHHLRLLSYLSSRAAKNHQNKPDQTT